MEVVIEPETFKSCNIHIIRTENGSYHPLECPPGIREKELKQAFDQALILIDMFFDISSRL